MTKKKSLDNIVIKLLRKEKRQEKRQTRIRTILNILVFFFQIYFIYEMEEMVRTKQSNISWVWIILYTMLSFFVLLLLTNKRKFSFDLFIDIINILIAIALIIIKIIYP